MSDQTECDQCGGEGGFDVGPLCTGSCDWCGGCYRQEQCDKCEGSGETDSECIDCGDVMVNNQCASECADEESA